MKKRCFIQSILKTPVKASRLLIILFLMQTILGNNTARAQAWTPVGTPRFSPQGIIETRIAIDNSGVPYVALVCTSIGLFTTGQLYVMKYNGSSWDMVGTNPITGGTMHISFVIGPGNTPYVAFPDTAHTNKATVMKFDGTNWVAVGSAGLSAGVVAYPSLAFDPSGTPYLGYTDFANQEKATVMKYNGTSWVTVGSAGFSNDSVTFTSLAIDGSGTPYLAFADSAYYALSFMYPKKATVMKFSGSSWVLVGAEAFSDAYASNLSLAIDGSGTPYITYENMKVYVMKYNGTAWVDVGGTGAVTPGQASWPTIAIDASGTPYIAFEDFYTFVAGVDGKATALKFDGTSWVTVGSAGFSAYDCRNVSIAVTPGGIPYVAYADNDTPASNLKATVMSPGTWLQTKTSSKLSSSKLTVAPNPCHGLFTLMVSAPLNEDIPVTITNMLGQRMIEISLQANKETELQSGLPPGMYFITAFSNKEMLCSKIVVE